jgi:hypothetical protein
LLSARQAVLVGYCWGENMDFVKKNKNILFSLLIACLLGIFQAFQTYFYKEYDSRYITEDVLGSVFGRLILWTIIPLIIASISKFVLKRQFGSALLKSMIIISIPFAFIGSYGHYQEYVNNVKSSTPVVNCKTGKFKEIKRFLELSNIPSLMTDQLNLIISEGDKKTRSANPETPAYVFDGMNQKLKSVMQAMIWEENGLMDQFTQIYLKYLTDEQVKKLINFYESPLWKKANSNKLLTGNDRERYNELYEYTFDNDIKFRKEKIIMESEAVSQEWLKYALPKGKAEMDDYLKSFGYTLDGYILNRIE